MAIGDLDNIFGDAQDDEKKKRQNPRAIAVNQGR